MATVVSSSVIQAHSVVELHFEIRLEDGSIADSTYETKQPFKFKMGRGMFSEIFETALLGLTPGARKDILLSSDQAFGPRHPAKVYQMPRNRFKETEALEIGLIFNFMQPNGTELPGVIRAVDEHEVTIDFNHPLAGLVVLFKVQILSVR